MKTLAFLAAFLMLAACTTAPAAIGKDNASDPPFPDAASQHIHFASLDLGGPGGTAVPVDGYLFRPATPGRHPALVFMHGCGGALTRSGALESRQRDWAARMVALGYVVLAVDSFTARGTRNMCSPARYDAAVYQARPKDAYGALRYLQAQDFVKPDAVGLMGWSEGGGATLHTLDAEEWRPPGLPLGDFRAAVAFYPASCSRKALPGWRATVPLLVLVGDSDVWTPAEPCQRLMDGAQRDGAPVQMKIYPGAYHDFDWPNQPIKRVSAYTTRRGVVPITGTDPAGRHDALARVPAFLAQYIR